MKDNITPEFGSVRRKIFPIHNHELKKFLPLATLFFFISYNYSVLRGSKDIFILTNSGADAIYYLKTIGVTPAIFLFTIIYTYFNMSAGIDRRFNSLLVYFSVFFFIYLFIFIPYDDAIQLKGVYNILAGSFPRFKGLWSIIRNWHSSLFYIHAELWGAYTLQVLFWTFANHIVDLKQAKRFYGLLIAIGANIGAIVAGLSVKYIFKGNPTLTLSAISIITILATITYNIFSRAISNNPESYQIPIVPIKKKKSPKLSFKKSFSILFKSNYLLLIATLVLGYNISIALFEAVWKDRLQVYAQGDSSILANLYGDQLTYIGILTIILLVFFYPWIEKRSWSFKAMLTPIIFLTGASSFFAFLYLGTGFKINIPEVQMEPLYLAVLVGLANVILIKASKYAFFDTSKEITYIPLEENLKVNGKAAVDGIGSRLGKTIGSVSVTMVFMHLPGAGGTIGGAKIYICIAILTIIIVWILAVIKLSKKFQEVTQNEEN